MGDDPTKSTWRPMAPLPFLRALGCVDDRFRPLRGGLCRGFQARAPTPSATTRTASASAPDERNPDRDEAQLADLDRLFRTLDRLTRRGRLRAPAATRRRFDVYMTEFGFQTRPPDRAAGVTLAQQARYVQQAAYILWRHPRVRSLTHYQWEDELVKRDGPEVRLRRLAVRPALLQRARQAGVAACSPPRSSTTAAAPCCGARCGRAARTSSPCRSATRARPCGGRWSRSRRTRRLLDVRLSRRRARRLPRRVGRAARPARRQARRPHVGRPGRRVRRGTPAHLDRPRKLTAPRSRRQSPDPAGCHARAALGKVPRPGARRDGQGARIAGVRRRSRRPVRCWARARRWRSPRPRSRRSRCRSARAP